MEGFPYDSGQRPLQSIQSLLTSQRFSYTFSRPFLQNVFRVGHPAEAYSTQVETGLVPLVGPFPTYKLSLDYRIFTCIKLNFGRMCSVEYMLW
jgi:hypothetical protein